MDCSSRARASEREYKHHCADVAIQQIYMADSWQLVEAFLTLAFYDLPLFLSCF